MVFEEKNLTIGQLVSNDEISGLQVEPQLYALGLDDKLYTALMFGRLNYKSFFLFFFFKFLKCLFVAEYNRCFFFFNFLFVTNLLY